MSANLKGAVLLGAAAEAQAVKDFKRNFAAPWEILRYRVAFRDRTTEETLTGLDDDAMLIRITDPGIKRALVITVSKANILEVSREPKAFREFLQMVSDGARQQMAQDARIAYRKAAVLDRFKAWRKRRKANAED